jgi:hypothetical protein
MGENKLFQMFQEDCWSNLTFLYKLWRDKILIF